MMEPISMIVGALVAGASAALKDTACQAIKDTYQGLKTLIVQYWKCKTEADVQINGKEAKMFLDALESDPTGFYKPLEKKLIEIMSEPEPALIEQAHRLIKLLDEAGQLPKKYSVTLGGKSQGVQIGDNNTQNNNFN